MFVIDRRPSRDRDGYYKEWSDYLIEKLAIRGGYLMKIFEKRLGRLI
jgi:hypothetical protein